MAYLFGHEMRSVCKPTEVDIATNVLLYYDVFDQSLALVNIATMLRPGGILLSNTPVIALPGIPMDIAGSAEVAEFTVPNIGIIRDRVTWYRRE